MAVAGECYICGYTTNRKYNYKSHLASQQHLDNQKNAKIKALSEKNEALMKTDEAPLEDISRKDSIIGSLRKQTKEINKRKDDVLTVDESDSNSEEEMPPEKIDANPMNNTITHDIQMKNSGYVYLLIEREFSKTKEAIYKIGRTMAENLTRFKQYPKGSVLVCQVMCCDCVKCEHDIISVFGKKYKQVKKVGDEYFEGNYDEMQRDIHIIVEYNNLIMNTHKQKNTCDLVEKTFDDTYNTIERDEHIEVPSKSKKDARAVSAKIKTKTKTVGINFCDICGYVADYACNYKLHLNSKHHVTATKEKLEEYYAVNSNLLEVNSNLLEMNSNLRTDNKQKNKLIVAMREETSDKTKTNKLISTAEKIIESGENESDNELDNEPESDNESDEESVESVKKPISKKKK